MQEGTFYMHLYLITHSHDTVHVAVTYQKHLQISLGSCELAGQLVSTLGAAR